MTKSSQDIIVQIVDEIISEMPLEDRVYLANLARNDVDVLQGVFDLYLRSKDDFDDDDYEDIMHELWQRLKKTYRLRVVK
jgi:hypothetical protein